MHPCLPSLAGREWTSPVRLSIAVTWTGLQGSCPFPCVPSMTLSSRHLPSLHRVPASPVPRCQRYYEGATTSHSRICDRLFVSLPQSTRCLRVRARFQRSRPGEGPRSGQGFAHAGCPSPACLRVDATGISQVFRRSVPCLCSVPGPRSSRRALAIAVTSVPPPLVGRRRPRTTSDFGADSRSFGTR
jgi:hypothetical protein